MQIHNFMIKYLNQWNKTLIIKMWKNKKKKKLLDKLKRYMETDKINLVIVLVWPWAHTEIAQINSIIQVLEINL